MDQKRLSAPKATIVLPSMAVRLIALSIVDS